MTTNGLERVSRRRVGRGSGTSPARHDGKRWCCCACRQGFLTSDGAPTRCCADGAPTGNADGEHELRRGSTDGSDSEHRRRGRERGGSESGSSGRERARLWEGEERNSAKFIERGRGNEEMAGWFLRRSSMAFTKLEWRERNGRVESPITQR
jgi:hypothetical protein